MERWRLMAEHRERFEVSDHGRVRVVATGLIRKTRPDKQGYRILDLYQGDRKFRTVKVHQLVMQYFGDEAPDPKYEIDHVDRDKANNHWTNLRWLSRSDNLRNVDAKSASGVKGVRYREGKPTPWQAYIILDKWTNIGHYASKEQAAVARQRFAEAAGVRW